MLVSELEKGWYRMGSYRVSVLYNVEVYNCRYTLRRDILFHLKGCWSPSGENVMIPVAIKILHDASSGNNEEFLAEARVMATIQHPFCVRLLAICMTSPLMLITELMPLGCLLNYVRVHKYHLASKHLLSWCTQIAKVSDTLVMKPDMCQHVHQL